MSVILCILDGWGIAADSEYNAISLADTPNYDWLLSNCVNSCLDASEGAVGLPKGQMGNSEVGHFTIGAGRIIKQGLPRIDDAFASGDVEKIKAFKNIVATPKSDVHLICLISDGGVHAHINHLLKMNSLLLAYGKKVHVHAIADGRDVGQKSVEKYLKILKDNGIEPVTISGRYYAMDRDKRWDRVELAYLAIVSGDAPKFSSAEELIAKSYKDQITDEFIQPHVHINYKGIEQGDSVMIMNFRADRVRQLAAALCDPDFDGFARDVLQLSCIVSMTEYDEHLDPYLQVMLPAEIPAQTLGQIVSERGLKQVRIAETEKYAHVTYFFNGGIEEPFTNEDRILIQSPRVKTYDLEPQMSCFKVAQEVIEVVKKGFHQFVCVNFANPDMVGHTGNLKATIAAIESVDKCLGQIVAVAKQFGYDLLITADHGNAECMHDEVSHQPLTSHTLNKVPLIYYGSNNIKLKDGGLANIAATVLSLLGMSKPEQMCEGLDLK